MKINIAHLFAGLFGAQAVVSAAMSAHSGLDESAITLIDRAVQFQMWHALALLFIGLVINQSRMIKCTAGLFIAGVVLFCGSLYLLGFADMRLFPLSAPIGGICLIAGWMSLAVYAVMKPSK